MNKVKAVRDYYNSAVETEWIRIENRPEFLLTCRYIDRYIKPGDKVLDIGGGPGRYSFYLAEKICERDEFISWSEHFMYIGRKR